MGRTRISTTVNQDILEKARSLNVGLNDAALIDLALHALVSNFRASEIDAEYSAYDSSPVDSEDDWGNLYSFREAAGKS